MIILNGNSLGARQKDLNEKVNEAVKNNVSFDTCKPEPEKIETDVDILFKIDIAAKCKNIDYILEVFKSNNSLYINRALQKCLWLGDDEFAVNINVEHLQENIFPRMSIKMKKKLLYSLSMYVTNENRASSFYEYCMKEKLYNAATKYLLKTSESYKRDIIQKKNKAYDFIDENRDKYLASFIGDSFSLADMYMESHGKETVYINDVLHVLRHLYSVSEVQYLDLIEKYTFVWYTYRESFRLGRRLSRNIMKSYKDRILKMPALYLNILDKNIISRNCTLDKAKLYAIALLPEDHSDFWHYNYPKMYKYILDIIPAPEKFSYIKKIFTEKYANKPFESCLEFYEKECYDLMTSEEREEWALRNVTSGEELLGSGNDYKWYKFVNFNKAFEEIKKYILITSNADERLEILQVLIESANSQNDLETLLNYYYNRHVNEAKYLKENFLVYLMEQHKVLNFNEKCWTALEKIFYSLEAFNKLNYNNCDSKYRAISLIYYIIRKKTVPAVLNDFIDMDIFDLYQIISLSSDLGAEKVEAIFQYFLQFYSSNVESICKETLNNDNLRKILRYIDLILNLLYNFEKKKDSIPELINTHIKLNWETVKEHNFFSEEKISKIDLKRSLKKEATQIIHDFPKLKKIFYGKNTNWLVWKLKIYFHHDIAHQYLQLVTESLSPDELYYNLIECAVYTIFNLAEDSYKVDFIEKYVPTTAKIDHVTIPQKTLDVQRAICSVACFSRPPLPLETILRFITGDYVKYCLPIFNSYLMNLTTPQCIVFIQELIDKPVSVQKHGVRLAFECFSTENLVILIKDTWKKFKNVSMRKIVYKLLFDNVLKRKGESQLQLFEVLKALNLDLHQDDDEEVFELITSHKMVHYLMGDFIVSAWETVKHFPEKTENFQRMANIVNVIEHWLHLIPENVLIAITDEHVADMLDNKQILNTDLKKGQELLFDAKWKLTDRYLSYVYTEEQIKRNLEVIKHITKKVIEMWNEVRNKKYVLREFCSSFLIRDLEEKSYDVHAVESYRNVNIIYSTILKMLQDTLPEHETYLLTWQLRLSEIARKIIITSKEEFKHSDNDEQISIAIKSSIHRFAEAFECLVKEYIQKGKYFVSFHERIESIVTNKLYKIISKAKTPRHVSFDINDLYVIMCTSLVKYDYPEMFLFILKIIPLEYTDQDKDNAFVHRPPPDLIKDYENVLQIIKTSNNVEVQYFMYKKFMLEDFKFRKYIAF